MDTETQRGAGPGVWMISIALCVGGLYLVRTMGGALFSMAVLAAVLAIALVALGLPFNRRTFKVHESYVHLAGGLLAVAIVAGYTYSTTRPNQLFRQVVADPIPDSVKILRGWRDSRGIDWAVYLHFEIAPADVPTLLGEHKYEKVEQGGGAGSTAPSWWRPSKLKLPTCYRYDDERCYVEVWVDQAESEVYFSYWDL